MGRSVQHQWISREEELFVIAYYNIETKKHYTNSCSTIELLLQKCKMKATVISSFPGLQAQEILQRPNRSGRRRNSTDWVFTLPLEAWSPKA